MSGDGMRHPTDALAEYAVGVLDAPERTTVETHLALAGQLTWLAPTLCLSGLGLLAGAVSGSPTVASIVVASLWVFEYAAVGPLHEHRWSRLLYLFATTRGTVDQDWAARAAC
jgi:hypothetical protein